VLWLIRFRSGSPSREPSGRETCRYFSPPLNAPVSPWQSCFQRFFHGSRNDFADAFAQCRHIFLCESLGLYGVRAEDRNFAGQSIRGRSGDAERIPRELTGTMGMHELLPTRKPPSWN